MYELDGRKNAINEKINNTSITINIIIKCNIAHAYRPKTLIKLRLIVWLNLVIIIILQLF